MAIGTPLTAPTNPGRSGWQLHAGDRVRLRTRLGWSDGRQHYGEPMGVPGTVLSVFKQTICGTWLATVKWDGESHTRQQMAIELISVQAGLTGAPLFGLWATDAEGQPSNPDADTPWGDRDPMAYVDEPDAATELGAWCTIVDEATEAFVWAGNIEGVLRQYVADVEAQLSLGSGHLLQWDGEGTPLITAVAKAREFAAEVTADEYGTEACRDWCEPNPDTSRPMRSMPESTRDNISAAAQDAGLSAEAEELAQRILKHAGLAS